MADHEREGRGPPLYSFVLGYDGDDSDDDAIESSDLSFSSDECPSSGHDTHPTIGWLSGVKSSVSFPSSSVTGPVRYANTPITTHINLTTSATPSQRCDSLCSALGPSGFTQINSARPLTLTAEDHNINNTISSSCSPLISMDISNDIEKHFESDKADLKDRSLHAGMSSANTMTSALELASRPNEHSTYDNLVELPNNLECNVPMSVDSTSTMVDNTCIDKTIEVSQHIKPHEVLQTKTSESCHLSGNPTMDTGDVPTSIEIKKISKINEKSLVRKDTAFKASKEKLCLKEKICYTVSQTQIHEQNRPTSGIARHVLKNQTETHTLMDTTTAVFTCQQPLCATVRKQPSSSLCQASSVFKDRIARGAISKLKDACKDMTKIGHEALSKIIPTTCDNIADLTSTWPVQNTQPNSCTNSEAHSNSQIFMGIKSLEYSRPARITLSKSSIAHNDTKYASCDLKAIKDPRRRRSSLHISTNDSDPNLIGPLQGLSSGDHIVKVTQAAGNGGEKCQLAQWRENGIKNIIVSSIFDDMEVTLSNKTCVNSVLSNASSPVATTKSTPQRHKPCVASDFMNKTTIISPKESETDISFDTESPDSQKKCTISITQSSETERHPSKFTKRRKSRSEIIRKLTSSPINKKICVNAAKNDSLQKVLQMEPSRSIKNIHVHEEGQITQLEKRENPQRKRCKKEKRNELDYHLCSRCMVDKTVVSLKPPKTKVKSQSCLKCEKRLNPKDLMCKLCRQSFPNMMIYAGHAFNKSSSGKECQNFVCKRCRQEFRYRFTFHTHLAQSECVHLCLDCETIFGSRESMRVHACKSTGF